MDTDKTPGKWTAQAKCRGETGIDFFGENVVDVERACRFCCGEDSSGECAVRMQCLEWALDLPEKSGVWGGYGPHDRIAISKLRDTQGRIVLIPRTPWFKLRSRRKRDA